MNNGKICSVPWKEAWLNPELKYGLCCKENQSIIDHSNSQEISLDQHWKKPSMVDIRKRFLSGQPVPECNLCWNQEDNGKESMRMRRNVRYLGHAEATAHDIDLFQGNLESLELLEGINLSVGNQCQLRCISCNPSYSRNIKKDYDKLNWSIHDKTRFDSKNSSNASHILSEKNIIELKKITPTLRWVALAGGEPTLSQPIKNYLKWCIENQYNKQMSLVITTNGVNVKTDFIDIIQQFQNVILTISVDGYGELDEYLRWPSNWDKKIDFIKRCQKIFNNLDIHTVVYGLNCLAIDKLIKFVHEQGIKHNLECLQWPSSLSIDNMPHDLKQIALEKISSMAGDLENNLHYYKNIKHGYHTINSTRALIKKLEMPSSPNWEQTTAIIRSYDTIRSKKLSQIIPDISY